jgi:hypothetical protein
MGEWNKPGAVMEKLRSSGTHHRQEIWLRIFKRIRKNRGTRRNV